jgi:hypothetical protein
MKKVLLRSFLPLAIFFSTSLAAQNNPFTGFYISPQHDTIRGVFPDYTEWTKNPSTVKFIGSSSSETVMLNPQLCQKFVVDGHDEYLSYSGQRQVNAIEDAEVVKAATGSDTRDVYENVDVFLRLITGSPKCDLYVFRDNRRVNFFYKLPAAPVAELKYKKYFDQNRIIEIPEYKQQLSLLFGPEIEKQKLTSSLETLDYEERELSHFFKTLFIDATAKGKEKKPASGLVVSGGVSINDVRVKADGNFTDIAKDYKSSVAPLLAVGYMLPLDRNFGRYFVFPQVKLYRYKNSGEIERGTFTKATSFQADLLIAGELNAGMHIVQSNNFRLFLSAGAGGIYQVNPTQTDQLYVASDHSIYGSPTETELLPWALSFNASVGVVLNKNIVVTATYLFPSRISNFIAYETALSGVQLKLGYKFR